MNNGIDRLIATHPLEVAGIDDLREMIALGAYLEYTFLHCMPSVNKTTPDGLVSAVRTLGWSTAWSRPISASG